MDTTGNIISAQCHYCESRCDIPEGLTGRCSMYRASKGTIVEQYPDSYLNIYPVSSESIPLLHFYPNSTFLLISTMGCNFACGGCISEYQTSRNRSVSETLVPHAPEEILDIARKGNCQGISFCLNEPTVSLPTFLRVAQAAKREGFLVGCSTNGYMTEETVHTLIPWLDYVNIGLKGYSDERYQECGVPSADPVFRNTRILHDAGIAIEVSIMYLNERENEVIQAAERIRDISPDIPLQVMRFMAIIDKNNASLEPTREQGEELCRQLQRRLRHVYLFNTPATTMLDSRCLRCGKVIIHRVFFGPMAARILTSEPDGICSCGYRYACTGAIRPVKTEESEILGGYRSVIGVRFIAEILRTLGVTERDRIDQYCNTVITNGYLHSVQNRAGTPESYCEMVKYLSKLAHRDKQGTILVDYIRSLIADVQEKVAGCQKPRVITVLSHPLYPLYAEKFENNLVEIAGGRSLNREIRYTEQTHAEYTVDAFNAINPDIILISGHFPTPVPKFLEICQEIGIRVKAISEKRVFTLDERYVPTTPPWIIGLLEMANLIHPDRCHYSLMDEETRFNTLVHGLLEYHA